jgi:hypothetical protein
MATQNKNTLGYKTGAYAANILGMSLGDILSGQHYNLTTARDRIPFVNNWTSALFTTLKGIYSTYVPDEAYALYKKQEQEIISTAMANAERVRAKGEVELRSLRYKHDIEMGSDIIKVSGSGGNMSGSFLDALMQQRKYQMIDEQNVMNNTTEQASAIMREAYRNAANVATQAQTAAQKQKNGVLSSLMAGIDKYFELSFKDKALAAQQDALNESLEKSKENKEQDRKERYGKYKADQVIDGIDLKQKQDVTDAVQQTDSTKVSFGLPGDSYFDLNSDSNSFLNGGIGNYIV